jgi:hypothetical protein
MNGKTGIFPVHINPVESIDVDLFETGMGKLGAFRFAGGDLRKIIGFLPATRFPSGKG